MQEHAYNDYSHQSDLQNLLKSIAICGGVALPDWVSEMLGKEHGVVTSTQKKYPPPWNDGAK